MSNYSDVLDDYYAHIEDRHFRGKISEGDFDFMANKLFEWLMEHRRKKEEAD